MARRLISSGSAFESAIGYSRAVVSGDWVFVSGCTGYIYLSVCLQHVSTYATSLLLPFPLSHIPCLPTYLSSSPSPRTTNATKLNRTKIYMKKKTSYDYAANTLPTGVVDQAEQCLRNIAAALTEANASVDDVVRVRYILPDRRDFPLVWPVLRRWFAAARPAATMMQAGLLEEAMKIEVEVTARKGEGGAGGEAGEKMSDASEADVVNL